MRVNNLVVVPVSFAQAKQFVTEHHRHHRPPQGWKFGVGVKSGDVLVGVAMVGRPVSRSLDNGLTLEVTRCCTDTTKNACSMLYGAARRAAKALGYRRIVTYILEQESGTSLKASGWRMTAQVQGQPWTNNTRKRADDHPLGPKTRWEADL